MKVEVDFSYENDTKKQGNEDDICKKKENRIFKQNHLNQNTVFQTNSLCTFISIKVKTYCILKTIIFQMCLHLISFDVENKFVTQC